MDLNNKYLRPIRHIHDAIQVPLRRSPTLVKWLFGLTIEHPPPVEMWDYTTLELCRIMPRYLRDGMRVWEPGCGVVSICSRFALTRAKIDVVASDLLPWCVEWSRRNARHQPAITVIESDLDAQVDGEFDLVLFNAPYLPAGCPSLLPTSRPTQGDAAARYQRRFLGGEDGLKVIALFLRCLPVRLSPTGHALLGFNTLYVSADSVANLAYQTGLHVEVMRPLSSNLARFSMARVLAIRRCS